MVPKVYQEVKGFIDMNVKFAEDLDLSHTEVDEIIRKSTNQLLSKTLSGAMSSLMREGSPNLQQLTQMSINTTHLEVHSSNHIQHAYPSPHPPLSPAPTFPGSQASAQHLERYISSLTHSLADDVHVTRLHGSSAFKDARTAAEEQIFLVLQVGLDSPLQLRSLNARAPLVLVFLSEPNRSVSGACRVRLGASGRAQRLERVHF